MEQPTLLFRADGNANTGLGHLYRIFALIEVFKPFYNCVLVTKESSTLTVIPKEYTTKIIPKTITIENEPNWLHDNFPASKYIVIADGYQFTISYQKQLKNHNYFFVYVDDLLREETTADIVINHSENIVENDYKKANVNQFALGAKYAILRPEFLKIAKKEREITEISTAFVCFGGADMFDLSLKTTQALLQTPTIQTIHIVVGGAYKHKEIFEIAKSNASVHIYQNLDAITLSELMQECTIAIAPASTILYELCAIKMPILSGYFVDNQKNIYHSLVDKKLIFGGGDFSQYKVEDFKHQLEIILKKSTFETYINNQKQLFDGNSGNRLLALLNSNFIHFRKANEKDMLTVFNWSNDALVRENSFNSEEIQLKNHQAWFLSKIKDEKTVFLIAQFFNEDIGVVRFELENDNAVVGILIDKNFRNKKLASSILKRSAQYYFNTFSLPILAYIKSTNKASINAFKRAGYKFSANKNIKGIPSKLYKLTKNAI